MTATDILARAIGLYDPLTSETIEQICDARLAEPEDFEIVSTAGADGPYYAYIGSRWTVLFMLGRCHLIEVVNVPPDAPGPAVTAAEQAFALAIDVAEITFERPMSLESVAEARRGPWERTLREAAEQDAAASGQGSGETASGSNDANESNDDTDGEEDMDDEEG